MGIERAAVVCCTSLLLWLGMTGAASAGGPRATGERVASLRGSEADASAAPAPRAGPAQSTGEEASDVAAPAGEQGDAEQTPAAERRDGFMVGILLGGAFGGASGYPNDADKIDREAYYTNTGVALGGGGSLWIGGAVIDWLTVGLGVSLAGLYPSDQSVQSGAIDLNLEFFPAWALGGEWREMGVYLKTGAGLATVEPADGSDPVVDTGGASRLGFGLFYEGIRAWQISMGPFAGGDMLWSPSGFRPIGLLGWRTVLYTGP